MDGKSLLNSAACIAGVIREEGGGGGRLRWGYFSITTPCLFTPVMQAINSF